MIKPAARLDFINEYYFSRKSKELDQLKNSGADVINLGIGNPDRPPPKEFIKRFVEELNNNKNHGYQSYKGLNDLRSAFAEYYFKSYNVSINPETETIPLIGSKEGIAFLSLTFLNSFDTVLIPDPAYPVYQSQAELSGAKVQKYDLKETNNWQPDIEQIKSFDLNKVKLMWINFPNMPTGAKADIVIIEKLYELSLNYNFILCNDNPYSRVLNSGAPFSLLKLNKDFNNIVELNSVSKSHNLAGLRIGSLSGDKNIIEQVLRLKSNFDSGIYKPSQLAASTALLTDNNWFDNLNAIYAKRRLSAYRLFNLLNISYNTNQDGMFLWGKIPDEFTDSYAMSDQILASRHIFLTPGAIFGENGRKYIRLSLASSNSDIENAIDRIS